MPQYQVNMVKEDDGSCQLIKVAFPKVLLSDKKKLCHCHGNLCYQTLECPNCKAYMCYNQFYQ